MKKIILEKTEDNEWFKIKYNNIEGYEPKYFIKINIEYNLSEYFINNKEVENIDLINDLNIFEKKTIDNLYIEIYNSIFFIGDNKNSTNILKFTNLVEKNIKEIDEYNFWYHLFYFQDLLTEEFKEKYKDKIKQE